VRKLLALAAAFISALAIGLAPAGAITDGVPDVNNAYPHVGIMVASIEGVPQFRCSGTLLSPTAFLTAGHCTDGVDHVEIWFRNGYPTPIGAADGYPFTGDVGGTPIAHPDYDPNAFFLRDVGVVVLDEPWETPGGVYGTLPGLNSLDALKHQQGKAIFDAVGYGLQEAGPKPKHDVAIRTRMISHPKLIQINVPGFVGDFSMLLSNNSSTGGTCFGDSGGPNFLAGTNVVAGVTSFGKNGNCAGTGGVFRMDRSWSLDFVNDFLSPS
jgi:hypothetical protein